MIKIFQIAIELFFGFTVATCVIPIEDKGKDVTIEPIRFVCIAEVNASGPYMITGQIFKMKEELAKEITGEWL